MSNKVITHYIKDNFITALSNIILCVCVGFQHVSSLLCRSDTRQFQKFFFQSEQESVVCKILRNAIEHCYHRA